MGAPTLGTAAGTESRTKIVNVGGPGRSVPGHLCHPMEGEGGRAAAGHDRAVRRADRARM